MIKAIIIDDERLARNELKKLLMDYPEIEVVAEAANAGEGIEKIEHINPDLIFLDIQMPGKTGFDLLSELDRAPNDHSGQKKQRIHLFCFCLPRWIQKNSIIRRMMKLKRWI